MGEKMGKTTGGSTWLDPNLTSPYQFYQYFINVEDAMVEQLLKLYTFLSLDEIARLASLEGADIRAAKEVLAFEATRLSHGDDGGRTGAGGVTGAVRRRGRSRRRGTDDAVSGAELAAGIALVDLLVLAGLAKSKGEARRLIGQGGASVNGDDRDRCRCARQLRRSSR